VLLPLAVGGNGRSAAARVEERLANS
jgi:hypothetical protein